MFWAAGAMFFLIMAAAPAFNVVKNVNDGKPPVERILIFEKGKPHDHLIIEDKLGNCDVRYAEDGAIEAIITGNEPIQPTISWKPNGDLKETFNANDYTYLVMTFAMEGDVTRTFPNGRTSASRPGNMWFPVTMYDTNGVRTAQVNPASLTDDKTTPAEVVTLNIPMMLFIKGAFNDTTKIQSIAFPWGKTHDYNDRNIRLVIERMVLAD